MTILYKVWESLRESQSAGNTSLADRWASQSQFQYSAQGRHDSLDERQDDKIHVSEHFHCMKQVACSLYSELHGTNNICIIMTRWYFVALKWAGRVGFNGVTGWPLPLCLSCLWNLGCQGAYGAWSVLVFHMLVMLVVSMTKCLWFLRCLQKKRAYGT